MNEKVFFKKNCDKHDKSHIDLTYITHFYCNQKSIDSVVELLREYEKYPSDILDRVEFVIVDDCSPLEYSIPHFNLNFRWLRIVTDIPWNQGGARNLGATLAKSDKILMSDLDHAIPFKTLEFLANHRNPGRNFYKLWRKKQDGTIYKRAFQSIFYEPSSIFTLLWLR